MSKFRSNMQVFHVKTCLDNCSGAKRYRSCYLASKVSISFLHVEFYYNTLSVIILKLLGSRLKLNLLHIMKRDSGSEI